MKNYWLYLESFVFIFSDEKRVLLYNTLNGDSVIHEKCHEINCIIDQLNESNSGYCVLLTENQLMDANISLFIKDIRDSFSGDIIDCDYSNGKPFILKPILDLIEDPEKIKRNKKDTLNTDLLGYIHEINIYLNSNCNQKCTNCSDYYKQFVFCTKTTNSELLTEEEYQLLFYRLSVIGIQRIKIIKIIAGSISDCPHFFYICKLADKLNLKMSVYTHYANIDNNIIKNISTFENIHLVLLVNNCMKNHIKDINIITKDVSISYQFVISSIEDFNEVEKLTDMVDKEYTPFYNKSNSAFFSDYIFLTLNDILNNPISKQTIFVRQVMNENFFGKLYIMPGGIVYANVNQKPLGDLKCNSLNEIVYNEMAEGKSWLMKRENKPCSNCIYKFLCPSPSNYELAIGKLNLCHVKS
jgi:pseudo-rSAM protein